MAVYIPVTNIPTQFFDDAGAPLVGGSLEFYLAGTSTATDLFSDDAGTSIGTSIDLNAWGYPESGGNAVFLFRDQSKAIKIIKKDALGATVGPDADDIPAVASFDSTSSAKLDFITVTQAVDLDTMETDLATAYQVDGTVPTTADLAMGTGTFYKGSLTAGIAASATQTQGSVPLTSEINEVATVTTALDVVTLPAAVAGRVVRIFNNGANRLQVFPAASDSIDSLAANASVKIPPGSNMTFVAHSAVIWNTASHGTANHRLILSAAMSATTDTAAVSVANYYTTLTTTGAAVPTLADGYEGQLKKIQMIVDVGDAVLTPANLAGGTTITFADVGDTAELVFTAGEWYVIALYNIADGVTAPVLA